MPRPIGCHIPVKKDTIGELFMATASVIIPEMDTALNYKVADLSLAEWGRKEI